MNHNLPKMLKARTPGQCFWFLCCYISLILLLLCLLPSYRWGRGIIFPGFPSVSACVRLSKAFPTALLSTSGGQFLTFSLSVTDTAAEAPAVLWLQVQTGLERREMRPVFNETRLPARPLRRTVAVYMRPRMDWYLLQPRYAQIRWSLYS